MEKLILDPNITYEYDEVTKSIRLYDHQYDMYIDEFDDVNEESCV